MNIFDNSLCHLENHIYEYNYQHILYNYYFLYLLSLYIFYMFDNMVYNSFHYNQSSTLQAHDNNHKNFIYFFYHQKLDNMNCSYYKNHINQMNRLYKNNENILNLNTCKFFLNHLLLKSSHLYN